MTSTEVAKRAVSLRIQQIMGIIPKYSVRSISSRILNENRTVGRTDLEEKSSAEEREAYIGTLSEETTIE